MGRDAQGMCAECAGEGDDFSAKNRASGGSIWAKMNAEGRHTFSRSTDPARYSDPQIRMRAPGVAAAMPRDRVR